MNRFEVGCRYGTWDSAVPPVLVIKRTEHMATVQDELGVVWRMKIKQHETGEYMTDSSVPHDWRECYTYDTRFKED